jgi:hypothetical protein
MRPYGLSVPPQVDLSSDSPSETVVHASPGANEIRPIELSDGAGPVIAVREGMAVTIFEVGYAIVVTPYGLMQYTLPWFLLVW